MEYFCNRCKASVDDALVEKITANLWIHKFKDNSEKCIGPIGKRPICTR